MRTEAARGCSRFVKLLFLSPNAPPGLSGRGFLQVSRGMPGLRQGRSPARVGFRVVAETRMGGQETTFLAFFD